MEAPKNGPLGRVIIPWFIYIFFIRLLQVFPPVCQHLMSFVLRYMAFAESTHKNMQSHLRSFLQFCSSFKLKCIMTDFSICLNESKWHSVINIKFLFDFNIPSPRFCRLKMWNFTSGHVKNRAKGELGIVTLWRRHTRNGVDAKTNYVGRIAQS